VPPKSLDEVDPEIPRTYEKLGIPLPDQELLAGVVRQVDGREDGGASEEAGCGRRRVRFGLCRNDVGM
jgi:Fe-S cluster assembly protein SufB